MARFLFIARYSSDGVRAVARSGGTARRTAIESMAGRLGGRVESFDYAFGDDDLYTIVELPDNQAAAAVALAVNSTGLVSVRTVVLMTPAEVDAAAGREVGYVPPGG